MHTIREPHKDYGLTLIEGDIVEPDQQQLLTVEQAAHALGVGRTKVFALVASGAISSVRIGRRRLIPREAVTEFVADLRRAHETALHQ